MTHFNENFCTDDFDQEMIDFITDKLNIEVTGERNYTTPNLEHKILQYDTFWDNFWTENNYVTGSKHLTKEEFKEKIGMTTNKVRDPMFNSTGDFNIKLGQKNTSRSVPLLHPILQEFSKMDDFYIYVSKEGYISLSWLENDYILKDEDDLLNFKTAYDILSELLVKDDNE